VFLMSEVPLYWKRGFTGPRERLDRTILLLLPSGVVWTGVILSSDDVFQERSARYRAVEPEQWLQRHPEAGSSWPSLTVIEFG